MKFIDRFVALLFAQLAIYNSVCFFLLAFEISGRTLLSFVIAFALVALVGTIVWSRSPRIDSARWMQVLHWIIRGGLIHMMLWYGLAKLMPGGQFGIPPLVEVDKPYYALKPFWKAFAFFGHSKMYEFAMAGAELLGAVLLLSDRTKRLGLCLLLPILVNLLLVNIAFEIGIHLLAGLLLAFDLYLLAHEARWFLAAFFARDPSTMGVRMRRVVSVALLALVIGNGVQFVYLNTRYPLPVKNAVYGIWQVEKSTVPWTKVYFDFDSEGQVRESEKLHRMSYSIDEKARHLRIRVDDRDAFDGTYRIEGSSLVLSAAAGSIVLKRMY